MGEFVKNPDDRDLQIIEIRNNKRDYLSLPLLADEQEDNEKIGECVVTDEGNGVLEIQNLAIDPVFQKSGYGKKLIEFIADRFHDHFTVLQAGTGDSPLTVPFYEKCGFIRHHMVRNYFIEYYDHPIFEAGKQLIDKIYLRREI